MESQKDSPSFSKEQVNAMLSTGVLLKFVARANNSAHDEDNHQKVVAYVFENLHDEHLIHSLISRGITGYEEIMTGLKEAALNPALQEGML